VAAETQSAKAVVSSFAAFSIFRSPTAIQKSARS
jgi:hypothetical protein